MGFIESIKNSLKKYSTFSGRASRSEFWYFILFVILTIITFLFIVYIEKKLLLYLFSLLVLILLPFFAILTRRLHDLNISGWWLINVPISLIILSILAYFARVPILIVLFMMTWPKVATCLAFLIGLICIMTPIYILCKKGTIGDNRFGKDPLQN